MEHTTKLHLLTMKTISFFILSFFLFSCQNNEDIEISHDLLIGNWVETTYENETITFQRSDSLQENAFGVSFKKNGAFINRSAGWCGTPILFHDIEGNWQSKNTLIMVSLQGYPGDFNWRIISLDEEQLIVTRELTDQEKNH